VNSVPAVVENNLYGRPAVRVRGNRRPLIAVGQKRPECCGLAHRFCAPDAFCLPKQKHDAQFAQLIEPSQERVYRLALRITRNTEDAEDVQQETMLKVHRKLGQFEGRSRFTTWISRIAINEALMCLRKRQSTVHTALEEAMPSAEEILASDDFQSVTEGPEAAYSRKELRDLLMRAIATLRPAHRVVFLLRAIEELSTTDTARVLKISVSAVKVRMCRARSELQDYLRKACPAATHERPNGKASQFLKRGDVIGRWEKQNYVARKRSTASPVGNARTRFGQPAGDCWQETVVPTDATVLIQTETATYHQRTGRSNESTSECP